jgi:Carboxypeptidase regulatory-like domain
VTPLARTFGLIVVLTMAAWAQSAQQSQPTSSVAGTVIDSVTRQPMRGVGVRARSFGAGQSTAHFASSTSDAEGHFVLDAMAPGRYMITAMQQGYLGQRIAGGGSNGRFLNVAPDQHTDDLVIELIPGANISGHIKNADGKPMARVSIEVVKYFYSGSQKELRGVAAPSFTNADGEYRIAGVAPGKYYVRAIAPDAPPSEKPSLDKPPAKDQAKAPAKEEAQAKPEAYVTTYYPNGSDVASSSPLVVRAGQDVAGIDITLTPVRALTIDGRTLISGSRDPAPSAELTLANADGSSSDRRATADAKGVFTLPNIPPGDYVIVARVEPATPKSKMLFGQKAIHVDDKNISKIDVLIGSGVQISGRIHVDDKTNADLTKITAMLEPEGNSSVTALMPEVNNAEVRADGSFTFVDVPEGMYSLDLSPVPAGFYLKSTGAIDVLETGVSVAQGQSPAPVDLTLTASAAQLTGVVLNDQMPAPEIRVVLVPAGSRHGQSRFFKRAITDASGHFTMKGVIPGDYKVLALDGVDRSSMNDPDYLEQFEDRGESVHLQEGGVQDVRLNTISAGDATP